jgi:hypothetical protein
MWATLFAAIPIGPGFIAASTKALRSSSCSRVSASGISDIEHETKYEFIMIQFSENGFAK